MSRWKELAGELQRCSMAMAGIAVILDGMASRKDVPEEVLAGEAGGDGGPDTEEAPAGGASDPGTEGASAGRADVSQPPAAEPEKKALALEDVRAVLAEKSRAGHTAEVRALLQKHGADRLSEIDPAEYASLLADAEVL